MRYRQALPALLAALVLRFPARAQEPAPVRITAAALALPDQVVLDFAWRFRAGGQPDGADPALDDSAWRPARPAILAADFPAGWPGEGWFRRHVRFDPELRGRPLAIRVEAPGLAEVYLDGVPLSAPAAAAPELGFVRKEAYLVTVPDRAESVLAVRYRNRSPGSAGLARPGFVLHLAHPGHVAPLPPALIVGLHGAAVALPLFLAFLHLALFAFYPRARENLWYALSMAVFSPLILSDYAESLGLGEGARAVLTRLNTPLPLAAVLFAFLTYDTIRLGRLPRSARLFAIAGALLAVAVFAVPWLVRSAWIFYFAAFLVDVVRLERSGAVVNREGSGLFLASASVLGIFVTLQALLNYRVIPPIAGVSVVYVFGMLGSAVGMSLFLARTFGRSRILEAENERKTRELEEARALQLSMLPGTLPAVPGLELAAATLTATEVGGDYYDFRVDGATLVVAFGDATGHGLASGIVVTAVKALFGALPLDAPLPESLAACDRVLRGMRFRNHQMCLALARLTAGSAALASAAMPPALVHRAASGLLEELGAGGLPLGCRLQTSWAERTATLSPGDTLLFASDGFPELAGPDGPLGFQGAAEAFRRAAHERDAAAVLAALERETAAWRGPLAQEDDVTFVVVRVL